MNATEREKAARLVTRAIVELSTALESILNGLEDENGVEDYLQSAAANADQATDLVTGEYEEPPTFCPAVRGSQSSEGGDS